MKLTARVFLLVAFLPAVLFSQKEEKKWDVNAPANQPYSDVKFTTDEGTWMNLDVSPDSKTIVFDLLGDIYSMPVSGGAATCLRSGIAWEVQPRFSPDGRQILFTSDAGGGDNCWLMNADGSKARQVTKESFRLLNNGTWISNDYFVVRKHFTNTRSLGAGEMWMFHTSGGEGIQLTKRKNDQQDVNEPTCSPDGKFIYFSEDMYPGGFFQYNKDPNDEVFVIQKYDREKGTTEQIIGGSGGACRPQISRDGKKLAYIRRVRTKTVLMVRNLETGEEEPVYDNLSKDQQEAWTIFGCYPGFAWMPDNRNIIIWSGGKINRLWTPLFESEKEKMGGGPIVGMPLPQEIIPFSAAVNMKVAETLRFDNPVFEDKFTARAIRQATTSPDGKTLLFNAAGFLYKKSLPDGQPERLNSSPLGGGREGVDLEFEGVYSPDGKSVAFVSWNDEQKGAIWKMDFPGGKPVKLTSEKGIWRTPNFSPDGKQIVFRKEDGNDHQGYTFCEKPGIYMMDADGRNLKFITPQGENPRFSADGKRIFVQTGGYLFGSMKKSLKSFDLNGQDEKTIFNTQYTNQFVPSPDEKWVAFTELHKVYVAAMPLPGQAVGLSGDTKSVPVSLVGRDAGYNLHWSGDSKQLHYTLGDEYFSIDLNERFAFLPGAKDTLPPLDTVGLKIGLQLESDRPTGTIVLTNARIITMENNVVIDKGDIVIKENRIVSVGKKGAFPIPSGGTVIDCTGKTIMPGIIDAHAHSGNFRFGLSPQKQWEYWANLAYGVTTSHDPSTNSEMVFSQSEMLKAGRMVGPRLFSTGTILYGADGDFKAPINSLDDARATLRRTKAWGAFSVKSYNQPRREQRQWVIAAARELKMEVVPEGGSFFYHNLTQVVDGHTGIEHNIPVAPLFKDVTTLWGKTKSHNTPTLIVNYGGLNGEFYWYEHSDVWKKQRLLNFTPRYVIDGRSRHVTKAPDEEYQNGHILVSKSCKKLTDAGVKINLGAHGQLQGLGAHWELWSLAQGGMTNMECLQSATINGAVYLGLDKEIGSLKAGKLADLVVLDKNPLDDIQNSESIRYTMINGRLYESETMNEMGKSARPRTKFWWELPGAGVVSIPAGMTLGRMKCVCGQ